MYTFLHSIYYTHYTVYMMKFSKDNANFKIFISQTSVYHYTVCGNKL